MALLDPMEVERYVFASEMSLCTLVLEKATHQNSYSFLLLVVTAVVVVLVVVVVAAAVYHYEGHCG
jgi:hypothetical protein